MKNLFIMHTQYNLILAAAVISEQKDAENTLVLYSEFSLNQDIRNALARVFDRVLVVRDNFCAVPPPLEEIRQIRRDMKKVKCLKNERFDNIYMSQERIFDRILCARAKKNNPAVRCYNIEEDAYYSINEKLNADDFKYQQTWREKRRNFLYALLLAGYPYNYRDIHYCYGMSSEYHGARLLFPWLARRELQGKELLEVGRGELLAGIEALYSTTKMDVPVSEKYIVFFFDLISRYKDVEKVKNIVDEFVRRSAEVGRAVIFKYHPRETDKFVLAGEYFEIPHIIPAEKVLHDMKNTDTVVVGNATTSCVVAAKLGFKVVSICKLQSPANEKMHTAMKKMGILCIEDADEIEKII